MKWTWHQGHTWKTSEVYSLPASYFFPAFYFLPLSKVRHLRRYFGFTHVFTPIWLIMQKWILEWNIHWEFLWLGARSVWRQSMVCLFGVKSCQLWYGLYHCPALKNSSSFTIAYHKQRFLSLGTCLFDGLHHISEQISKYHHTFKIFSGLNCEVRIWTLLLSSC